MARFASALSEHPLATHATGEVIGQVMDALEGTPSLAMVFVTGGHAGSLEDIGSTVQSMLSPDVLLGIAAVSVIGNGREVEEAPAVVLWATTIPDVMAVRLAAERSPDGWGIEGFPDDVDDGTLLLLADPFSFPTEGFLDHLSRRAPALEVVGGLASAAMRQGGNRLLYNDTIYVDGAIGVRVPPGVITTVVSQGCRPVGDPFTITKADHNLLHELGGRSALARLTELLAEVDDETRVLMNQGLHLGVVVNEQQLDFRRGDFLIRGVVGVDKESGSIAVGDRLEVGQTVQFQVRDAATADEDLDELMRGKDADSALVFTCNGRGSHLFEVANHDALAVFDAIDRSPVAGMFCAGEIGPVGGANHMHGFTASIALF